MSDGVKIVLTADRTLMSNYGGGIFLGFSACVPTGLMPPKLYFKIFCPPVETGREGAAVFAPYGTRKIESALLNYGFDENDVMVVSPDHLYRVVGPDTKVIGITENDPLGIGPATTTFRGLFGGVPFMTTKFLEILTQHRLSRFKPRIILGGPGAWQLAEEEKRKALGVDCVVVGEGELVVPPLTEKAVRGERIPGVVYGQPTPEEEIPPIRKPSICGLVEIARGCGRGCKFCTPTLSKFRCHPVDYVLKEVEVNVRAGNPFVLLHAEDVLRYKAKGLRINSEKVLSLFKAVKTHPGVRSVGISHFALSSVVAAPHLVEGISEILELDAQNWLSGQVGIETGSHRMIEQHMVGKCKPFKPEEWPEIVVQAFEVLSENNWVPVSTLILGLPGERESDVFDTIHLVRELRGFKSLIVPLFFVAMGMLREEKSFTLDEMKPAHVELLLECWEHNFYWFPRLIREYQGVKSYFKRKVLSLILWYASLFARQLSRICREDYDNDLQRFKNDFNEGKARKGVLKLTSLYDLFQKLLTQHRTQPTQ